MNLTQAAATTAIGNAGLTVGAVTTASSTTVPAGSVISQNPVAARRSRPAAPSHSSCRPARRRRGPERREPDAGGGHHRVSSAGLTVGTVTHGVEHDGAGRLGHQSEPGAGTLVASGSAVALVVSSGPPGTTTYHAQDDFSSTQGYRNWYYL